MFGLSKKEKVESATKEIETWIVSESMKAGEHLTVFLESEACDGRLYKRLISTIPSPDSMTSANQCGLIMEAGAFYLHALSRAAFRQESELLREAVFDPVVLSLGDLFQKMIKIANSNLNTDTEEVLGFISTRELEYSKFSSLLGASGGDRACSVWLAANNLADITGKAKNLPFVLQAQTCLLRGLLSLDLSKKLKPIALLLN